MAKQRTGWKGESRRHSLARKGIKTNLPDGRRFDVSNFVANGRIIHGYNIDEIYNGFISAMLWATIDQNISDETHLDSNYGIYDVDKDTEQAIKNRIEDFISENYEILDEIQINEDISISEEQIGHDLFLTTQGHGVGFWDRGYGYNGELLTKECKKFFDDSMYAYAGDDGKIYFEGLDLKNTGLKASGISSEVNKIKKNLINKAKRKGLYENFGQIEIRALKDKYSDYQYGNPEQRKQWEMIERLDDWAMNYDGR